MSDAVMGVIAGGVIGWGTQWLTNWFGYRRDVKLRKEERGHRRLEELRGMYALVLQVSLEFAAAKYTSQVTEGSRFLETRAQLDLRGTKKARQALDALSQVKMHLTDSHVRWDEAYERLVGAAQEHIADAEREGGR